jgi:LPS-assembly protein
MQSHKATGSGHSPCRPLGNTARPGYRRTVLTGFVLALMLLVSPAAASDAGNDRFFTDSPDQPWHITADQITQDRRTGRSVAKGNVVITKQGRKLTADRVRFDESADTLLAEGHVMLTTGEDVLTGQRLVMDLAAETGTVYNGTVFLSRNHFYIRGETIRKTGKNTYEVQDAHVTSCDGDAPAWHLTGKKFNVTVEGYGYATHAALWARKLPVMYTPALVFPVKIRRQTGLLPPLVGHSERKWEEYEQPFFWAINDASDATVYFHHMQRRGEKLGLEYRYVLDKDARGAVMADGFDDRKVDAGPTATTNTEWGYTGDNDLRPNSDRYWIRMKHDQRLPGNVTAKLDLDVVSDQDYLDEFRSGYMGFDAADDYFAQTFGRDLDEYDDDVRTNALTLNRTWTGYSLNARALWYDDVIKRRRGTADTTLQQLPVVEFDASRKKLLDSPFYASLDSAYHNFYRETGMRGHRIEAYPRVYLPLKYRNFFSFEPSVGIRETAWHIDSFDTAASTGKDRDLTRELYDLKLDLTSDAYRVFPGFGSSVRAVRHSLRPQVVYEYTPNLVQDKYPSFDSADRIPAKNRITYSVTNTLTAKSVQDSKPAARGKPTTKESYRYSEFTRLKLVQSHDITKERDGDPEPFSDIGAELDITPGRYFSIDLDAAWSPYSHDFTSRNLGVRVWDDRGDKVRVEHRYSQGSSETFYANAEARITEPVSAYLEHERNMHTDRDILTRVGLVYKSQCWSIDLRYSDEGSGRSYSFLIHLFGIGDIGSNVAGNRLENPMSGQENNP